MDKRLYTAIIVLVVIVAAILVARRGKQGPPEATVDNPPFAELRVERPKDPAAAKDWIHPAIRATDQVTIGKAGKAVELRRTKEAKTPQETAEWELTAPVKYPGHASNLRSLIQRLTTLQFWEPASREAKEHASLGVDEAHGVRITLKSGSRVVADLIFGKEVRTTLADKPMTYTYLRQAGKAVTWKVVGPFQALVDKPLSAWRDDKVLTVKRDDIVELTVTTEKGTLTATRNADEKDAKKKSANWVLRSATPAIDAVDQGDLGRITSTLSFLRAQDFADGLKPADAGLEPAVATITVTEKGKPPVAVLIGKTFEKDVERGKKTVKEKSVYLQVKGQPQIFVLTESRVSSLLKSPAELRDRTVIKLADQQQVVRMEILKDGETTILAREGGKWTAVQPKDLKIDEAAVDREVKSLSTRWNAKAFSTETDVAKTGLDKPVGRILLTVETGAAPAPAAPPPKDADAMAPDAMAPDAMAAGDQKPDAMAAAKAPPAPPAPAGKVVTTVIEILIGKEAAKRELYVQVKGRPDVFVMNEFSLKSLWKPSKDWVKKAAPAGGPGMPGGMPGMPPGGMPGRGMPRRPPVQVQQH